MPDSGRIRHRARNRCDDRRFRRRSARAHSFRRSGDDRRHAQELLDRVDATATRGLQAMRFRLAVLARRLHEQAIGRATSLLHRSLARRLQRVDDAEERLRTSILKRLADRERRRRVCQDRLRHFDPRPRLRRDRERLNDGAFRAISALRLQLARRRRRFEAAAVKLSQLDPKLILSRGYAIVLNERAEIVHVAAAAPVGSEVKILLAKDALKARITE